MKNFNNVKKIRWTEDEVNIIKKEYPNKTLKEIQEMIPNRTISMIRNKANSLGIKNKNYRHGCGYSFKWSKEEDDLLIDTYSSTPIEEILKIFPKRNKSSIQQRASKLGLKYLYYNENYFDVIDTEEKAYWLGFIYADGYVTTQYRFGIEISLCDKSHLEKFKECINSNIVVKTRCRNGNSTCSVYFKNTNLYNSLVSKGVNRNKTYSLSFPCEDILQKNFYRDFIRGYFDGNGTFSITKQKSTKGYYYLREANIVSLNEEFLTKIRDIIEMYSDCKMKLYNTKREGRLDLKSIRCFSKSNILKFINYIYYENCLCLERKEIKMNQLLENCLA